MICCRIVSPCRKRDAEAAGPPSPGPKRSAKAARKLEAADSGELEDLLGDEELVNAPKRKAAGGKLPEQKPPPYHQVHAF